jgi:hypothetical protein
MEVAMTDVYSNDATPAAPVDPTPDDAGGPISQEEAGYRDGNLMYHCGLCQNFQGAANGTCTKVQGEISPYGLSDEYDGVQNPLLSKTPGQFRPPKGGFKTYQAAQGSGPTDEEPAPPPARIGRQVY